MKFAVVFRNFEKIHLNKDVGGIPIAISRYVSQAPIIYYSGKEEINHQRLVFKNFLITNKVKFYFYVLRDLIKEDVDAVNLYHLNSETLYFSVLLKLIGKKVYIKSDINYTEADKLKDYLERNYFKLNPLIMRFVDLISIECRRIFRDFKSINILNKRIMYFPNAIYDKGIKVVDWDDKNNNILVVARHGCPNKNTELILDALLNIEDLNSWNIYFIGSATPDFIKKLDNFRASKKEIFSIKYISYIENSELLELYNNSKVFLMTSYSEGFSLAMAEAAAFGCQIISTDVGGYEDLTDNGKYGICIEKNDVQSTRNAIEGIISSKLLLTTKEWESYCSYIKNNMNHTAYIKELIAKLSR